MELTGEWRKLNKGGEIDACSTHGDMKIDTEFWPQELKGVNHWNI
jgi:hypothetical protein